MKPIKNKIIQIVNDEMGVDCRANTRTQHIKDARFLAMYFLWKNGINKSKIGNIFKRNRTTIYNALKKVEDYRFEKEFNNHFKRIDQRIKNQVIEIKEDVLKEILAICPEELLKRYNDAI